MARNIAVLDIKLRRHTHDGLEGRSNDRAALLVDGRPLLHLVAASDDQELRRARREEAAAEMRRRGRTPPTSPERPEWQDVEADELLSPGHLFGVPEARWTCFRNEPEVGIVGLVVCECGIPGCEAVIADFDEDDGQIAWLRLRNATAANHDPLPRFDRTPLPDLVFDADQYRRALRRARRGLSQTPAGADSSSEVERHH